MSNWIKMELNTPEKPEVLAITARLGFDDPDLIVGKLFKFWRWFDQNTTDGNAVSVTTALLDRLIGVSGFCDAVAAVGWLEVSSEGLHLVNYGKHTGAEAKKRALTAQRVKTHKTKTNASIVTKVTLEALPKALPKALPNTINSNANSVSDESYPQINRGYPQINESYPQVTHKNTKNFQGCEELGLGESERERESKRERERGIVKGEREGENEREGEIEGERKEERGVDINLVVNQFNEFAFNVGLSQVSKVNERRKKGVMARFSESGFNLQSIFDEIERSKFMRGANSQGWRVDFDFIFLSAHNWIKIVEGKYRDYGGNAINNLRRVYDAI